VTEEKLIGNFLANQARVEKSHGGRKQCFWEARLHLPSLKKKLKTLEVLGFFYSVTSPKISKLN
jgi:hypothetical protein